MTISFENPPLLLFDDADKMEMSIAICDSILSSWAWVDFFWRNMMAVMMMQMMRGPFFDILNLVMKIINDNVFSPIVPASL